MRVSTDACDSFGDTPILFNKGRQKPSETHVHMNWHFFGMTIMSNRCDRVTGAVRIVRIWGINTDGILIDVSFHIADTHLKVFVERNDPWLNIEVIASFDSCHMASFADNQVGLDHSVIFHFILPVCQNGHHYWLRSTRLASATGQSLLIFQTDCFSSHVNYLILHLLDIGTQFVMQWVWIWKMFGKISNKFTVSFECVPWSWKLPLEGLSLASITKLYFWWLVGYFI